jgi:hypothetical protein
MFYLIQLLLVLLPLQQQLADLQVQHFFIHYQVVFNI